MELEETIERLTLKAITSSADAPDYPNCIVMKKDLITILNHLTKQEKMIELMAEYIKDLDIDEDICSKNIINPQLCNEEYSNCKECIKQYFEKKAEEEN